MEEQENSFAQLLIAHLPRLRRYAWALAGNAAAADDLVQDCIERALKSMHSLNDPLRISSWLRSILHNLYRDELRQRQRRGTAVDVSEVDNDLLLSTPASDSAIKRDFLRALDTLSIEHRQILLLVGLEGMEYREIAAELDIPIGTVMSRLARARERLRQAMETGNDLNPAVEPFPARRVVQ